MANNEDETITKQKTAVPKVDEGEAKEGGESSLAKKRHDYLQQQKDNSPPSRP